MEDPTANSHRAKELRPKPRPEDPTTVKKVERVVAEGGVVEQKKSLGRKFRDLFVGADAKGALNYVVIEVMVPAARNMIIEATTKGIERIMYPDSNPPGGRRIYGPTVGSRVSSVSYGSVGGYRPSATRPPIGRPIDTRVAQRPQPDYVIASRSEAETVVERMGDLIEVYQVVTVADLHDLIGIPTVHTENKWGWDNLRGVEVRPVREGYLITLPPAEPLSF